MDDAETPTSKMEGEEKATLSKEEKTAVETLRKLHGRCAAAAFEMADRGNSWDKLFRALDRNHDKSLDKQEFIRACREVLELTEESFADDVVEGVFTLLDEDGGGALDVQVLCRTRWGLAPQPYMSQP